MKTIFAEGVDDPHHENGGCANTTISETHTNMSQHVVWVVESPTHTTRGK